MPCMCCVTGLDRCEILEKQRISEGVVKILDNPALNFVALLFCS